MVISWNEIEDSIVKAFCSENPRQFYNFFLKIIEKKQLTCINSIEKLKLLFTTLPPENKYKIFELLQNNTILNNFNAREIVDLYGIFSPEDAYKFFTSDFIIHQLRGILTSEIDCEDILSYFPCQNGIRDSVRAIFNTHLIQPKEPNNTSIPSKSRNAKLTLNNLLYGDNTHFYKNANNANSDKKSSVDEAPQNKGTGLIIRS